VYEHGSDFVFFHVSRADQEGYLKRFPDHRSYMVPVGVDEVPCELSWREDLAPPGKVRFLFVGSLGVKINLDAIEFFKKDFYPLLKAEVGGDLEVLVVGSNPSAKVSRLCKDMGWMLYPNVSDEELTRLYRTATFSILPFRYATGSKLKLLQSLANGVPYLATHVLRDQVEEVMYPCLISSEPEEWLHHIKRVRGEGISNDVRIALMDEARRCSWTSVARQTFQLLSHDTYSGGHNG
jgi:glycosyltransferase involved in cell wall biosynthesis